MPVSRAKKPFTISGIPGCGPDEVVFARARFTVGDQEEINNQLLAMSLENADKGKVDMQANFGAIKRATITQMVESWTLKEDVEGVITPLPQIHEDPEVVSELDVEVADYLFMAIQMRRNPADAPKTPEQKKEQDENFLASASGAGSENSTKTNDSL